MWNAQTILVNEECSPMSRVKSYYFPLIVAWWMTFVLGIILHLLKCNLCADFSLVTIVILQRGQLLFILLDLI